jgi:hypothetical protein
MAGAVIHAFFKAHQVVNQLTLPFGGIRATLPRPGAPEGPATTSNVSRSNDTLMPTPASPAVAAYMACATRQREALPRPLWLRLLQMPQSYGFAVTSRTAVAVTSLPTGFPASSRTRALFSFSQLVGRASTCPFAPGLNLT